MSKMTPAAADLKEQALAKFLSTDGSQADSAELVDFEGVDKGSYIDERFGGDYVILRREGEVVGIYKVVTSFSHGPEKMVRTEGGGVAFQINSISISTSLKRIKRAPKGLLP